MIESSIEELYAAINNSKEYKEYIEISSMLNDNLEVKNLIDEIKELQKEATRLEYNENDKYKEIDNIIKVKTEILNNNEYYKEYLSKLKKFNSVLVGSSSLIEEYIDEKVSV